MSGHSSVLRQRALPTFGALSLQLKVALAVVVVIAVAERAPAVALGCFALLTGFSAYASP